MRGVASFACLSTTLARVWHLRHMVLQPLNQCLLTRLALDHHYNTIPSLAHRYSVFKSKNISDTDVDCDYCEMAGSRDFSYSIVEPSMFQSN